MSLSSSRSQQAFQVIARSAHLQFNAYSDLFPRTSPHVDMRSCDQHCP